MKLKKVSGFHFWRWQKQMKYRLTILGFISTLEEKNDTNQNEESSSSLALEQINHHCHNQILSPHYCRDPSPWWHVAHISIRISPRGHVARFPYLNSLRERHTTLANIASRRPPYHIWTTDISYPDMFVWIVD